MDENHATLSGHQKRLIRLFRTEAKTSCDLGGLVRRSAVSALDLVRDKKRRAEHQLSPALHCNHGKALLLSIVERHARSRR